MVGSRPERVVKGAPEQQEETRAQPWGVKPAIEQRGANRCANRVEPREKYPVPVADHSCMGRVFIFKVIFIVLALKED